MRKVLAIVLIGVLTAEPVAATPPLLTALQLDAFCRATTIGEAAARGDGLGWRRLSGPRLEAWRTAFLARNGGTVELLTWGRGESESDGLLSFWIAPGVNPHRACSYSISNPEGLLDALSERLGFPSNLDRHEFGTLAFWKHGSTEVSFSQVGSAVSVIFVHHEGAR